MYYRWLKALIPGLTLLFFLIVPVLNLNPVFAQNPALPSSSAPKSILLLYSAGFHLPAYRKNMAAFMTVMDKASFPANNIYFEHLELIRQGGPEYRRSLVDIIHKKYGAKKIDLLITIEAPARDFVLKDCQDLFPGTPLLSILSADTIQPAACPRWMVQITNSLDFAKTLKAALALFPKTKRVFVVLGSGPDEQRWGGDVRKQVEPWSGKLDFEYTSQLTYEEMLQRVASLPPEMVVIYLAYYKDKTGRAFVPAEVARALTKAANAPVFGVYDQILGLVVGGAMISYETEGARAAKLALDILDGNFSFTEPYATLTTLTTPMFNWQQLHRWGVSQSLLPAGSVVINRPASIWEDYKEYVVGSIAITAFQFLLIVSLLVTRRRRIKAELNRQMAEERYRQIVELANEGIWAVDSDYRTTFVNQMMADMLGYTPEEMVGRFAEDFVSPEDLEAYKLNQEKRRQGFSEEYDRRWVRKDGKVIWTLGRAAPIINNQGVFSGAFAMYTDITERKRAEEQILASLKEKEILLQEIHHRVRNNLTIITSILSLQFPHIEDKKSQEIFRECENRVRTMSKIHTKLYQSKDLAHIDFGSYLKEVSNDLFLSYQVDSKAVVLAVHIDGISFDITTAVPLGLMLTELITNSLKYAFPKGRKGKLEITLQRRDDYIVLTVADNGVGFPEGLDYKNTSSLGLQLVMGLVQQLKGTIVMKRDQGTVFTITFQKAN